uniref:RING-type E3 ubiquitin transferase n=1 Tax=Erpetoichthys calabaricus TaxID=27687 RepID=A0A8C4RS40_ERPCA
MLFVYIIATLWTIFRISYNFTPPLHNSFNYRCLFLYLQKKLLPISANALTWVPFSISGIVKPDGESLASQFVPRCFGVIQRIIIQEYRRALNMITYIWDSKKQNRKEVIHTVPFSLVPVSGYDPGISVHVDSPLSASVLSLEPVYCYIRKAKMAFTDYFVLELNGQKPWWLEEKEEMLKVGSTLTGFGELILDSNRMLRLRPPQDGQKYLLIISDYRSYLQHQESSVTVWKVLTGVFGLLGVALLLLNIYRRCRRRRGNSIGKRHTIEETWRSKKTQVTSTEENIFSDRSLVLSVQDGCSSGYDGFQREEVDPNEQTLEVMSVTEKLPIFQSAEEAKEGILTQFQPLEQQRITITRALKLSPSRMCMTIFKNV